MFNWLKKKKVVTPISKWVKIDESFRSFTMPVVVLGIRGNDINVRLRTTIERLECDGNVKDYRITHFWDCPKLWRDSFLMNDDEIRTIESEVERYFASADKYPESSGCYVRHTWEQASNLSFD